MLRLVGKPKHGNRVPQGPQAARSLRLDGTSRKPSINALRDVLKSLEVRNGFRRV